MGDLKPVYTPLKQGTVITWRHIFERKGRSNEPDSKKGDGMKVFLF